MKPFYSLTRNASAKAGVLIALFGLLTGSFVEADTIFTVRQTFSVGEVPAEAKQVRGWFWMPEDRPEQKVLDFRIVEAPQSFRITRDPRYGRSWLYAEVNTPKPLKIVTEFKVLRKAVSGMADAQKAGQVTESYNRAFTTELNQKEKHMEVSPEIILLAERLAGSEQNPVKMARIFFQHVIDVSEHYSKFGPTPKGKCLGDAKECMLGTGDCCTDQHALFIALCRARGIPCRLMYGSRLKPENEGKDHDPGYRCWPNFFAPGLGWVPLDISSADTAPAGKAANWFGGLDENRLEWAEGRDFDFEPRSAVRPDLVIRGWVEVDGKPHSHLIRTVNFTRQAVPPSGNGLSTAQK
ncbi:MAG TPA: transglutaminase domain-containing protein [Candidatus Saccharimonadales bacterium]|nr:transglutaminase domain-containing protein [Candidatus Saccharimonadales bacterium]